jgi:hypothetical protein
LEDSTDYIIKHKLNALRETHPIPERKRDGVSGNEVEGIKSLDPYIIWPKFSFFL